MNVKLGSGVIRVMGRVSPLGGPFRDPFPPLLPKPTLPLPPLPPTTPRRVFIVHGHDRGVLAEIEAFVLKAKWKPVVLKDQSSPGENLLDELVKHSRGVSFAIVILSADDVGRLKTKPETESRYRARQNAIFEFGFLIKQLGKKKVFVLHHKGVELPSDYGGAIYIPYDASGAWKSLLAKAIKGAGIYLNVNLVI